MFKKHRKFEFAMEIKRILLVFYVITTQFTSTKAKEASKRTSNSPGISMILKFQIEKLYDEYKAIVNQGIWQGFKSETERKNLRNHYRTKVDKMKNFTNSHLKTKQFERRHRRQRFQLHAKYLYE